MRNVLHARVVYLSALSVHYLRMPHATFFYNRVSREIRNEFVVSAQAKQTQMGGTHCVRAHFVFGHILIQWDHIIRFGSDFPHQCILFLPRTTLPSIRHTVHFVELVFHTLPLALKHQIQRDMLMPGPIYIVQPENIKNRAERRHHVVSTETVVYHVIMHHAHGPCALLSVSF